jgi:minor extracellular serine protease Vpr
MRRSPLRAALVAVLALLAGPAAALAAGPSETVGSAWASQWLVELEGPPAADGTSKAALDADHRRFRDEAQAAGVRYRQRFAYNTLFNGVSVSAGQAAAAKIGHLDGVAAVYPVEAIPLDVRTEAFDPDLTFALTMTGADIAQNRLGYTGRGIHVAVIDSGIDYDHPDLGGCFGPACRVTNGYDLVGDDYDEEESDPAWQPVPHPDPDPDDCLGHGTHVAGIIGGNGGIRGVAPDVTFASYRVFGCNGATSTDVMLAAMERVYRDGADVLNMSIGEQRNAWPQGPVAEAASRLVRKGIVVVAAAGNDRLQGLYAAGAPGVGKNVIDVGSVDNLKQYAPAFTISPDSRGVIYIAGNGSAPVPASGTLPIARTGTVTSTDDACNPLPPTNDLQGKVALVRRGTCTFLTKATNVSATGAAAMVVYSNDDTFFGLPFVPGIQIPVAYISRSDGELINARLDAGPVSLTWGSIAALPNPSAGQLSSFSSDGLAADLSLKPDIAAPGGSILSTWPLEKSRYAVVSGTSMASPHVAGAAALYLQAHPRTRARDVRTAFQNSADPVPRPDGTVEPVVRQGAGLIDIDDAILATARITPGKLSLGDDGSAAKHPLTILNRGRSALTYALSKTDAPALAGRDIFVEHSEAGPSTVAFTHARHAMASITVPAHGRARLDVSITPDAGLSEGAVYGGHLVFTPSDGGPPLRVPYAGYKGDYQAVPAMTPTTQGYPWLARQTSVTIDGAGAVHPVYAKQDAGATFTLAPVSFGPRRGADIPVVLVHLNNFARRIRVEVFSPGRRRSVGEAFRQDYVLRNPVDNLLAQPWSLVTPLPFDGTVRRGGERLQLPDGEYELRVTVERALAGRDTPVETWTSPPFRIDRST